jgi:hypothetical protein
LKLAINTSTHSNGNMIAIHTDWDDEQWLDSLQKTMLEAFNLGVLPDYSNQQSPGPPLASCLGEA